LKKFIFALAALFMTTVAHGQRDDYDRYNRGQNPLQIAQDISQTAQRLSQVVSRTAPRGHFANRQVAEISNLAYQLQNRLRFGNDRRNRNIAAVRIANYLQNRVHILENSLRRDRDLSHNFRIKYLVNSLQNLTANVVRTLNSGGNGGGHYPPREQYRCVAVDQGWEEHRGGHQGFGPSRFAAERQAIQSCNREHRSCRIVECQVAN